MLINPPLPPYPTSPWPSILQEYGRVEHKLAGSVRLYVFVAKADWENELLRRERHRLIQLILRYRMSECALRGRTARAGPMRLGRGEEGVALPRGRGRSA